MRAGIKGSSARNEYGCGSHHTAPRFARLGEFALTRLSWQERMCLPERSFLLICIMKKIKAAAENDHEQEHCEDVRLSIVGFDEFFRKELHEPIEYLAQHLTIASEVKRNPSAFIVLPFMHGDKTPPYTKVIQILRCDESYIVLL